VGAEKRQCLVEAGMGGCSFHGGIPLKKKWPTRPVFLRNSNLAHL